MVQRLFFAIITQRDHKYATPPPAVKAIFVFLATVPTDVLTAEIRKTKFTVGKVLHIYEKTKALHHCRNYCTSVHVLPNVFSKQ